VWNGISSAGEPSAAPGVPGAAEPFLRQLAWREFALHVLVHFPHSAREPWNEQFRRFPWLEDAKSLRAWQRGRTGYPIVDAGMRELWRTGWMHNRVRMIVASFLTKHLLIRWREGAAWFWETLVDADLANNTMGWQWVAGSGTDAAPYFRVFNPTLQGKKFDPDGTYVRRWVPALRRVPAPWIHEPWAASPLALREAGVVLGETYPLPIVEHGAARQRALAAYARMRGG
jgi:deoxyribodipyrimidine photo-lyase